MLEKAQADLDAQISSYYHYGLDDGIGKGRNDKAKEMAKMMIEDCEPMEKISKYTKLPLEVIKALQN